VLSARLKAHHRAIEESTQEKQSFLISRGTNIKPVAIGAKRREAGRWSPQNAGGTDFGQGACTIRWRALTSYYEMRGW